MPESEVVLEELDMDVRMAAVIWTDGTPQPEVTFSGCSAYEAIGMFDAALRKLRHDYRLPAADDDDDEDDLLF